MNIHCYFVQICNRSKYKFWKVGKIAYIICVLFAKNSINENNLLFLLGLTWDCKIMLTKYLISLSGDAVYCWLVFVTKCVQLLYKSCLHFRLLSLYLKMMRSLNCLRRYSHSCRKRHCTRITRQMALLFFGLLDHLTSDQASESGE